MLELHSVSKPHSETVYYTAVMSLTPPQGLEGEWSPGKGSYLLLWVSCMYKINCESNNYAFIKFFRNEIDYVETHNFAQNLGQ